MLYQPPRIIRWIFNDVLWRIAGERKSLYLTFDDGPTPEVTPWILNELDKYSARATFFCVGANVDKYPDLFAEIIERGHSVGNHSQNHENGLKMHSTDYLKDVMKADEIIQSKLYRPPYGKLRFSQLLKLKKRFRIVMWDVLSRDFDLNISVDSCKKIVVDCAKPGSIIVFHDSEKAQQKVKELIPFVLEHYSERGYDFLPVSQAV